ncbi:hypothetical protein NDU88_002067 [Pleurodeles waltl]|uniref:Uncharacterized protein n=1 Tax=Pleurodeles waltl TaxID=8319 RepID=A0AAV7LCT2_PLEWA|nr:hypothetical protein NDU88_002067 [Pleurodeles waltl]
MGPQPRPAECAVYKRSAAINRGRTTETADPSGEAYEALRATAWDLHARRHRQVQPQDRGAEPSQSL